MSKYLELMYDINLAIKEASVKKHVAKPKISIVVLESNSLYDFANCLISLMYQSMEDIEILILDKNINNEIRKLASLLIENDTRIKSIKTSENIYDIACGEFIDFIDSKTHLAIDYYEKFYNNRIIEKSKKS